MAEQTWPLVIAGARGENVSTVQYLLNQAGTEPALEVDGQFGARTATAVKDFQKANDLHADGKVGGDTWPALVVEVSAAGNSSGPAVRAVQSQLNSRVDTPAEVNGEYDSDTEGLVRAFQQAVALEGLEADGAVKSDTWNALVNGYLSASNADDAAAAVVSSWKRRDRPSARKNASEEAVQAIFSGSQGWKHADSSPVEGGVKSTWKHSCERLIITTSDGPFYQVTGVEFDIF